MTRPEETEFDPERVVVRDKRRIDPTTGARRPDLEGSPGPASTAAYGEGAPTGVSAGPAGAGSDGQSGSPPTSGADAESLTVADLEAQLLERTEDLRRVTAEYANYRRRVERDREALREALLGNVLTSLLPVLDDIGRARQHEELTGGFAAVANALEQTLTKLGLTPVGEAGEPFDPTVHEAMTSAASPDVEVATAVRVYRPGYRVGERLLRPAQVEVAEPA